MKQLAILIPTKGHPDNIEAFVEKSKDALKSSGYDLYVGESDEKQESKSVIKKYNDAGYNNLHYHFFENNPESEMKVQMLCQMVSDEYHYLWICRDGLLPSFDNIYSQLDELMGKEYNVISIMRNDRSVRKGHYVSQAYTNLNEFFRELYWHMTFWGSYIIDYEMGLYFSKQSRSLKGTDNSFFMLEVVFNYLAEKKNFSAYNIVGDTYCDLHPGQKSTWRHKDHLLKIWAKAWCDTIDRLPSVYDSDKTYVKLSNNLNLNYFAIPKLLNFRAEGDFTTYSVKEYRKYIKEVANTPLLFFYAISLLPMKPMKFIKDLIIKH